MHWAGGEGCSLGAVDIGDGEACVALQGGLD